MRWRIACLLPLLLVIASFGSEPAAHAATTFPEGFRAEPILGGLNKPIAIEFLPDGTYFFAEKGQGADAAGRSAIKLVYNELGWDKTVLELSTNVYWDSGLINMILDPDFETNGYIYVWYGSGENALGWNGQSTVRLSRFTYDFKARMAGNEQVLLDTGIWFQWHLGGALVFDDAGNLYIGMGEADSGDRVQEVDNYYGKILRIRPTESGYAVPSDNPFVDVRGALPEIYAIGLRNPFRMTRNAAGQLIVGDVGGKHWEEANVITAGNNYGWPEREGPCPRGKKMPCTPAPAKYTEPILYYEHQVIREDGTIGGAISSLAFYEGTRFPFRYRNRLFFSDFSMGLIQMSEPEGGEVMSFGRWMWQIVDMTYYEDSLYFVRIETGDIYRLEYVGTPNNLPEVMFSADQAMGTAPLTVDFSAEAFDADGDALQFAWDFGDGSTLVTSTLAATLGHVYEVDGTYDVSLTVTDAEGESVTRTQRIQVYSGELPQIELVNVSDETRTQYHAGDMYELNALRSTTADLDPNTPWRWEVDLHHNTHTHPLVNGAAAQSHVLVIPRTNHDGDWDLWYEIRLIMTTETGQDVVVDESIFPVHAEVTLTAVGANEPVDLLINQVAMAVPYTLKSVVGMENQAVAPANSFDGFTVHRFFSWHNQFVGQTQFNFLTPAEDTTYAANYLFDRPADQIFMPMLTRNGDYPSTVNRKGVPLWSPNK